MDGPRYDGHADWYDEFVTERVPAFTAGVRELLTKLLGPGGGRCLDLGCGTGIYIAAVAKLGWDVVGVDLSQDQLRVARSRAGDVAELIHADASELPFPEESFDAVYSTLTHTDVEDVPTMFREARRVLRPRGRIVYVGTHPCFAGPFSWPDEQAGGRILEPGY
jgi:ubiquinone/menaquinone biosynthesis C-methylase UbiE